MPAHRLNDGRQVWIRPIEPGDAWRLQEGLRNLSAETIHRRFLGPKTHFTSRELEYLTEVDGINHIALVAVTVDTGRLVAVARAVRLPEEPDTAEWAVVVADPMQGKGLGTVLVRALVDEAHAVGIRHFSATMDGENRAVMRLLSHVTDHFTRNEIHRGVREVVVDV
jgi:RimJ/RimL family protein N-acetyltransferase